MPSKMYILYVVWFKMNKIQIAFSTISSDTFRLEYEMRYQGSEELQLLSMGRRNWGPKASCARLVGYSFPCEGSKSLAEQVEDTPSLSLLKSLHPVTAL